MTYIIYLTGKPGVGKYTIAKALAQSCGFIICDNQLINNPIIELLEYDGYANIPKFAWDSIAKIRSEIFNFLSIEKQKNYILTNCLAQNESDREIFNQVENMAKARGSIFVPIALCIKKDEHLMRLTNPDRLKRWKSIDPINAEDKEPTLSIIHPNFLNIEISNLSEREVAKIILDHMGIK